MAEQFTAWLSIFGFSLDDLEYRGSNGNTPLLIAALEGNSSVVTWLLEAGAESQAVNNDFNGAFFNACYASSPEVIEILVKAGADINYANPEGTTALMYAASASRTECVRTLLALGANSELQNQDGLRAIELTSNRDIFLQLRHA